MKKLWSALKAGLIVFAGSCLLTAAGSASERSVEVIKGFSYGPEGISYQVASGGCTLKRDFEVEIQETHPIGLVLVRTTPDLCEADVPYGTRIVFSWEELGFRGGEKFFIKNYIATGYIPMLP